MPLTVLSWFNPTLRPPTPLNPVGEDYDVIAQPSAWDQLVGQALSFGSDTLLLATTLEEGVDYPFYTRGTTAVAPIQPNWAGQTAAARRALEVSTLGLGIPEPIFAADPTTETLFHVKSLEYPFEAFRERRLEQWRLSAQAMRDAPGASSPGAWIETIPASAYTVTVCEIFSQIQEHLLQVVDGGQTMSPPLWTIAEVLASINMRISRFLMETGVIQKRTTQAAASADAFYNLPSDLIDLRRVAWTSGSTTTPLPRTDSLQADLWEESWESAGSPQMSIQVPEKSLELRVAPQPSSDGTLDLIYVANLPAVTNNCAPFEIPDEWTPFIKWGVLADLLGKEGEANDPARAAYAEQRYNEGVALARMYMGVNQ